MLDIELTLKVLLKVWYCDIIYHQQISCAVNVCCELTLISLFSRFKNMLSLDYRGSRSTNVKYLVSANTVQYAINALKRFSFAIAMDKTSVQAFSKKRRSVLLNAPQLSRIRPPRVSTEQCVPVALDLSKNNRRYYFGRALDRFFIYFYLRPIRADMDKQPPPYRWLQLYPPMPCLEHIANGSLITYQISAQWIKSFPRYEKRGAHVRACRWRHPTHDLGVTNSSPSSRWLKIWSVCGARVKNIKSYVIYSVKAD